MKMKELIESKYHEQLISNPDHKPKKIAAAIKKMLGRKVGKVEFVKADAFLPRGWDYGFYGIVKTTIPGGEVVNSAITINIADGEVSGNIQMDERGIVAVSRRSNFDQVLREMISELKMKLENIGKS